MSRLLGPRNSEQCDRPRYCLLSFITTLAAATLRDISILAVTSFHSPQQALRIARTPSDTHSSPAPLSRLLRRLSRLCTFVIEAPHQRGDAQQYKEDVTENPNVHGDGPMTFPCPMGERSNASSNVVEHRQ